MPGQLAQALHQLATSFLPEDHVAVQKAFPRDATKELDEAHKLLADKHIWEFDEHDPDNPANLPFEGLGIPAPDKKLMEKLSEVTERVHQLEDQIEAIGQGETWEEAHHVLQRPNEELHDHDMIGELTNLSRYSKKVSEVFEKGYETLESLIKQMNLREVQAVMKNENDREDALADTRANEPAQMDEEDMNEEELYNHALGEIQRKKELNQAQDEFAGVSSE